MTSLKGVRARFTKMAERMDIEGFFEEIDPDLLKYASAFRSIVNVGSHQV